MLTAKAGICLAISCTAVVATGQTFSVTDSIQMTRFNISPGGNPNGDVSFSPDGKYVVVVSSRGVISTNQIESTIWIFETTALRQFVNSKNKAAPAPRQLASVEGNPSERNYGAYKGVISDLQWSPDSGVLYYLGADNNKVRHLFTIGLDGKTPQQLSAVDQEVSNYAVSNGTIVYTSVQHSENNTLTSTSSGRTKASIVLTGMQLDSILFSKSGTEPQEHTLWMVRRHQPPKRVSAGSFFALDDSTQVLSLSPDGKYVAELLPRTERVPQRWSQYIPAPRTQDWQINPADKRLTSPDNIVALKQYSIIALDTSRVSILDAPMAESLGYGDAMMAHWSSDSRRLLVTNTFLPLEEESAFGDAHEKNRYPCTAVTVDNVAQNVECISWNRYQITPPLFRLANGSFTPSADMVQLSFAKGDGITQRERYRWDNHSWILSKTDENSDDSNPGHYSNSLAASVEEDLNSSPALVVTDLITKRSQELWNPNPQFALMKLGEASIYHWKDGSGFVWTGGLIKPVGYTPGTRYPLVIQTHGFRPSEFMTDGQFPTAMAARSLASAGIMVLQVWTHNEHLRSEQEAMDQVIGYKAAIDQLNAEELIDPKRVGIIGFSRTCWYVESALIDLPNLFKAATLADGVDESYLQYIMYAPGDLMFAKEFGAINGGPPFGNGLESWMRTAPGFHTDKIMAPLRIEAIGSPASILQEWEIYASLRLQDKPVDLVYLPHGEHILQAPLDRLASQQGNVDWFRFWLQGYEDPDPAKREQYNRWEHLRGLRDADLKDAATN